MMPDPLAITASRDHWLLDPAVTFLNHGSFGACPRVVLDHQTELRAEIERQPVRFFLREFGPRLDAARERVADFVDADRNTLAFVRNASAGVNAVLRSLQFQPGDEILVTDHGYGACNLAAHYVARRTGARVVTVALPFPDITPITVLDAVLAATTPRTRLALIDHITSPTGLVLPIEAIVQALDDRGIDTLVDGAHAPGMVHLSLRNLSAAYYTANLHKWTCAPKGAAFLSVRADRMEGLHPLSISHGHGFPTSLAQRSRYHLEFDWTGTDDPTPWLCAPVAIDAIEAMHPRGWLGWMHRNRALALAGRKLLADALGLPLPCPETMIGSLAALPLPPAEYGPATSPLDPGPFQTRLLDHGIEIPIIPWPAHPHRLIRLSAAFYNTLEDMQHLARVLPTLL